MRFLHAAIGLILLTLATPAAAQTAPGYCYSNNGLSWRACDANAPLLNGEVWFAVPPMPADLTSAFPGYMVAITAHTNALAASSDFNGAVAAGMQVTSTGNSALNGTYDISTPARTNLGGISTSFLNGKGVPGGGSTFFYQDLSGAPHTFAGSDIVNLGVAVENYYYALTIAEATEAAGGTPSWPTQPVTIP